MILFKLEIFLLLILLVMIVMSLLIFYYRLRQGSDIRFVGPNFKIELSHFEDFAIFCLTLILMAALVIQNKQIAKLNYTTNSVTSQNQINCMGDRCGYLKITTGSCVDCSDIDFLGIRHGEDTGIYLDSKLATKLLQLTRINQSWRVTEAYPPTTQHISECHSNGTCADIGVYPDIRTTQTVSNLCQDAEKAGLKITDEYPDSLVGPDSTCPPSHVFETTTGGHLHVQ